VSAVGPELNREDLAARVCTALRRHGVRVVLSGGGAASIYAPNPYESMDLDFIPIGLPRRVDAAMLELGFRKEPSATGRTPAPRSGSSSRRVQSRSVTKWSTSSPSGVPLTARWRSSPPPIA
jgi:hypothetical protein